MNRIFPSQRRRLRAAALGFLGAVTLLAGPLAEKGDAGSYYAEDCTTTGSTAFYSGTHPMTRFVDCAGQNGLVLSTPMGHSGPNAIGAWFINAPPGTYFSEVRFDQRGAGGGGSGWYPGAGVLATNGVWTGVSLWTDPNAGFRSTTSPPGRFLVVQTYLACGLGNGCPGSLAPFNFAKNFRFTMHDQVAPSVEIAGRLLNGDVKRGTQRIEISTSDAGSGIPAFEVLVNGQPAARRDYPCVPRALQPCPATHAVGVAVDTEAPPFHDGSNEVTVCAWDLSTESPPNVSCPAERTVSVDNSCQDSPAGGGTDLTATFRKNGGDKLAVKAGRGATLRGRLTSEGGDPVEGAVLCIKEQTLARGEGLADVGTVKTNSAGRFRYAVAPGPNRRIVVAYRHDAKQVARGLRFFSRAKAKLRLSDSRTRNGQRIRLFGSIPGPDNVRRVMILQARYPNGGPWKTFQRARTNRFGLFTAPYRFTATFATTRYQMRAVVPAQNGYPYLTGRSQPRRITVVGR